MEIKKFHTILPFICILTNTTESARIWFCSPACHSKFATNLTKMHQRKCGTLVERFCALKFNQEGRCANCEKLMKHQSGSQRAVR